MMNIPACSLIPLLALAPLAAGALPPASPATQVPSDDVSFHRLDGGKALLVLQREAATCTLYVHLREGAMSLLKGVYHVSAPGLVLDADACRVDETGLTVRLYRRAAHDLAELELTHRFDFSQFEDSFEFMSQPEDAAAFLGDFEGRPGGFMWSAPLAEKRRGEQPAAPAAPAVFEPQPLPQLAAERPDDCQALAVSLPGGGERVAVFSASGSMVGRVDAARPCALPDNRVTRALRRALSRKDLKQGVSLPGYLVADDCAELLTRKGELVPADRLLELCYRFRTWHSVCDWVCDAAGDNIVFLRDDASGLVTHEMIAYRWDEAKQAFVHRGTYYYCSRTLFLDPSGISFDDRGMRLHLVDRSQDGATELRYTCRFDYEGGPDTAYFIASGREQGEAYDAAFAGEPAAGAEPAEAEGKASAWCLCQPAGSSYRLVGVGGALLQELRELQARHPGVSKVLGLECVPAENRVTRQLPPCWEEAQEQAWEDNEAASWFCDEAGEHFVIVTRTDDFSAYGLSLYRWDEAKQAFAEVASASCETGGDWILNPVQVQFGPEGMNLSFLRVGDGGALESQWQYFPYDK